MGEEQEFRFDENGQSIKKSGMASFGKFLWNSQTKEFCGRDGASWGKVSLFYAIFYFCLGSFFVGMLAVFVQIMPKDKPTYYGQDGTISSRGLNPALGFRPQIDVEDNLISINPLVAEGDDGYKKYVKSLQNFLDAKYNNEIADESNLIDCVDGTTYVQDLKDGKACRYDQKKIFANTPCTKENQYAYNTASPCILLKLNRLIDFVPETNSSTSIAITCGPDGKHDNEKYRGATFYSEGANGHIDSIIEGSLPNKYFPYFVQKGFRAPIVWARFETPPNDATGIVCNAIATNIETERVTRRGSTRIVQKIITN